MRQGCTNLWIGPAGWSYDDWYGPFYPARRPRGFKPLEFIGRYFNAVEVNASFYRTPTAKVTAAWPALVPPEFRFSFKLHQQFTHDRAQFPDAAEVHAFRETVRPIRESGKLGPLLAQFPWSFRFSEAAVERLRRIADAFSEFERVIEVRHATWACPEAIAAVAEAGVFCNIDQPRLHDCLGPTAHVCAGRAYVRLHGRNAANWFRDDQPAFERYNYTYSEEEIREWVGRLRTMADTAEEVYVIGNNHYRAQAPANALELRALFEGRRVAAPPELVRAFPRLVAYADFAPPVPQLRQSTLFENGEMEPPRHQDTEKR